MASQEDTPAAADTDLAQPNATRPNQAHRVAAKRNADVQRYTVDLDREQRRTLALCAAEWEVDKSRIVRTLLYLLESDQQLRDRVQEELFQGTII